MKYINRKTVGGGILLILLMLIFFSKTIYTHRLPQITGVLPKNGALNQQEIARGTAQWADTESLYAQIGGKVEEVLVKEGDAVKEGQELLRLSYSPEEVEQRLRELKDSRTRIKLDLERIRLNTAKTERYMDALRNKVFEPDMPSSGDLALLDAEIAKAASHLKELEAQAEAGEDVSKEELESARYELQRLYIQRDNLIKSQEAARRNAYKTLEEQELDRRARLADYEDELAAIKLELSAKKIELSALAMQEESYKEALQEFSENAVLLAPAAGTITSLPVGKGEQVTEGMLLAKMGVGNRFFVDCALNLENNFVGVGEPCTLESASHRATGVVQALTSSAEGKTAQVLVEEAEIAAGETFSVTFKKSSDTTYILVPNGSLNKDNTGYFLMQIKRREGILGQEYYLDRLGVMIGESDSENTVIVRGIDFFEPILLRSAKPVAVGDTVLLGNEADFFEN
ncbi:MAG: HlyD family secretion protein [Christensenellaceae bacterium]|jgi:multidrug efflux pump subunit AcrA (membrane-fusion protein)|nr:HlyD family secretion protein [Christensenellaceae bacterium]